MLTKEMLLGLLSTEKSTKLKGPRNFCYQLSDLNLA
jgi:hypothetical protein